MASRALPLLSLLASTALSLNNGMGLTPAMGWSSWNALGCSAAFNESTIRAFADILASQYLQFGYSVLALDDCWAGPRLPNGSITSDPIRFPSGMQALGRYIISKGLQFGIYTDRGVKTCAGRPGSYGFEVQDAASYAEWGVTYVKNDDCNSPVNVTSEALYAVMRDAVNATGKAMYLNIKQDLVPHGFEAGADLGNSWRVANDIVADGRDIGRLMDTVAPLTGLAKQGAWSDLDSLEIGVVAPPYPGLSLNESMAMMSLWCVTSAQLMMGHDLRAIDAPTYAVLTNRAAIAVNQDPIAISGAKLRVGRTGRDEVWGKPLANGSFAVVLWNRNASLVCASCKPVTSSIVFWARLGFTGNATVTDIWSGQYVGVFQDYYEPSVYPLQAVFVIVTPVVNQSTLTGTGYWGSRATVGLLLEVMSTAYVCVYTCMRMSRMVASCISVDVSCARRALAFCVNL